MLGRVVRLLLLSCFSASLIPSTGAAATPEQKREASALTVQIRKAGSLFTQGMYKESGDVVTEVQQRLEKLAEGADESVIKLIEPIHRRVVRAHALLELEGIELEPIQQLKAAEPMPPSDEVSFTKQIAPLLVSKCGRCHVNQQRGEFSMPTYEALMRGPAAGVVVFPGDPTGSRMIEVIESGDMPRGGKLTDEEFTSLKKWIAQGAKFDGENQRANLNMFATAGNSGDTPVAVTRSTGNESVSFAADIAAVLAENCNGCHVNAQQQPRGGLNMSNFASLLRGGDSGPPVRPRNAANSLLVQRIKGEGGGARMPMGRAPLSDEVIAKIEKWINEGASFDGPDPNQNVVRVAALAKAQNSTHDELSAERVLLAEQNWRLGMNRIPFAKAETENFLLMGNVGEATLEEYGKEAEKLAPRVATMLGAPSDKPLIKGRMTLFVFNQRYDYSEFGQMVERRDLPKEWRGHWRFDVVDAYGAILPPNDDEYTLEALIGQQLAGNYAAAAGDVPRWFSEGVARVTAAKLEPKDPRVAAWNDALGAVLGRLNRPDDFLNGRLAPEDSDVASYSFMAFLMKDSRRFTTLMNALKANEPFEKSLALVYGRPADKLAEVWVANAARSLRRR